tara:strand:+ start:3609 stop:4655 length:1047 start_codon:yes stop_codon:yes gene_type:complete
MSVLFLDSFDHYNQMDEKWDAQFFGSNIFPVFDHGRFTPGALQIKGTGGGGTQTKNLDPPTSQEVIAGFAYNNTNADVYSARINFEDNLGNKAYLIIDFPSGVASFSYLGNNISTGLTIFTGSVWQHVEIRVKAHASLGELEIRRNGQTEASATGLNTLDVGFTGFSQFVIGADHNSQRHHLDDLYIFNTEGDKNNTFAGDTRITVLRPNANGLDNNFTPFGAADNYMAVDDAIHDQDLTYVEAGQIGAKERYSLFDFTELGISPGTVYCTQVVNASKKTDAGQLKYKDQMIIGGIAYDNGQADVIATSGTYQMTFMVNDTDPSDGGDWTEAKIAAIGSGIEITFREV